MNIVIEYERLLVTVTKKQKPVGGFQHYGGHTLNSIRFVAVLIENSHGLHSFVFSDSIYCHYDNSMLL